MRVVEFVIYIIGATKGRRELTAKRVVTLRAQCVPLIGVVNGTHQPIIVLAYRIKQLPSKEKSVVKVHGTPSAEMGYSLRATYKFYKTHS